MKDVEYAGFWVRAGATAIDIILLAIFYQPILMLGQGAWSSGFLSTLEGQMVMNYALQMVPILLFWHFQSATPGKMILKLKIIDAKTGRAPSIGQFIVRYLGYNLSALPLLLGFVWVGIDERKQGWHDKLAGTLVIRTDDDALTEPDG